jgi:hypothetical protein
MLNPYLLKPGDVAVVRGVSDWKLAIWETSDLNRGIDSLIGFMKPGSVVLIIGIANIGNRWPFSVKIHDGKLTGWVSSDTLVKIG